MNNTTNSGMPNILKFFLLIVLLSPLVFYFFKRNYELIETFEVNGKVVKINWKSRNHGMPIISIKQDDQIKHFKSNRITLDVGDVAVGDSFIKLADSKECKINNELIRCIN